jgi:undecaprenyl-diphosphatase
VGLVSLLQAAVLGVVQGLTEFLPISSTGHLILVSRLLGWQDQGLGFDMAVHVGSLLAVIAYLWSDIVQLTTACARSLAGRGGDSGAEGSRLGWQLAVATLPVLVGGLLAADLVAGAARNVQLIATTSIVFGLLLGWSDRLAERLHATGEIGWGAAVGVGLAQALALIPGTSRSGATITAGRAMGFSRELAARFSFLLAVPVGLLVAAKQVLDSLSGEPSGAGWAALAVGFAVSAASSFLAIHGLLAWLRRRSLRIFVLYRVFLGLALLGLNAG